MISRPKNKIYKYCTSLNFSLGPWCHWLTNLLDTKTKCRYLKRTVWGTLQQVFICLRPPTLLGLCLGWSSNFVGSESGQIQSVKLLQNMISNMTQNPLSATHCLYILYFDKGRGGGGWTREKIRWGSVYKTGSIIPTWLTVSQVYTLW